MAMPWEWAKFREALSVPPPTPSQTRSRRIAQSVLKVDTINDFSILHCWAGPPSAPTFALRVSPEALLKLVCVIATY